MSRHRLLKLSALTLLSGQLLTSVTNGFPVQAAYQSPVPGQPIRYEPLGAAAE